jgi:hypothetical protein
MRRLISIVLLTLACDLSEELDGEPCDVQEDCWHKQECARTQAERISDLPGVCADKGTGCTPGQQLGCVCVPDDSSMDCSYSLHSIETGYPAMMCDPTQLVCVIATPDASTEG